MNTTSFEVTEIFRSESEEERRQNLQCILEQYLAARPEPDADTP